MSVSVLLAHDDEIVVPVVTGLPAASEYTPLPFLLIVALLDSNWIIIA
jgi:hypothetical protein